MKIGYADAILSDQGKPIAATVTVYLAGTTDLATIWTDVAGSTEKENSFETDSLGRFQFFADPNLYDIQISGTGITTYTIEDVLIQGVYLKITTGDPSWSYEGMICINSFDNTVKVYADGGWRQLLTW
jgi:hypothetical protein